MSAATIVAGYFAVLATAAWAMAIVVAHALRSERREHARERQLLTNQLLHLSGKPWQPAPASETPAPEIPVRPYLVNPNRIPLTDD